MTRFLRPRRARSLPVLLALTLAASGCNVFESLYDAGASDDPAVLLQDAEIAIRRNEPEKAVTILEKAFQKAPNNPEVRVQLATALLSANSIDVLDLVSLYENLSRDAGGAAGSLSKTAGHCTFDDSALGTPRVRPFDPSYRNIQALLDKQTIIARVITLVQPILPALLSSAPYDAPNLTEAQARQLVTELQSRGLTDVQIANLLLINATASIIQLYNDMFFNTPGVTWYLVQDGGSEYIGGCATDIAAVTRKAACQLPRLQGAANSLRVRGVLIGGEAITLSDEFNGALTLLEEELGDGAVCTA